MASLEFLNQMSSSSSSGDGEDGTSSSSSSEENALAAAPVKPRIKLNIRMKEQPKEEAGAAPVANGHANNGFSGGASMIHHDACSSSDTSDDGQLATAQQPAVLQVEAQVAVPVLPEVPKKEADSSSSSADAAAVEEQKPPVATAVKPILPLNTTGNNETSSIASTAVKTEHSTKPPIQVNANEDGDTSEDELPLVVPKKEDAAKVKIKTKGSGDKPNPKLKDPSEIKKDPNKLPTKVGTKVAFKKPSLPLKKKLVAAAAGADTAAINGGESPNAIKKKKKKKMGFKLPLHQDRTTPTVSASIVNSSDDDGFDAVAVTLDGKMKGSKPKVKKVGPPRLKLPPIPSPGLITGANTPAHVFDQAMAEAGYTTEERTKRPHRGSSVRRVVGDMFDSNVAFSLHFPDLVPKDLWYGQQEKSTNGDDMESSTDSKTPLPDLLMRAMEPERPADDPIDVEASTSGSRKRLRPWPFKEMLPKSLTIPYPRSYMGRQLEYVHEVGEREKAIIAYQRRQEEIEDEYDEDDNVPKIPNNVKVPTIPRPPTPPALSEFASALDLNQFDDKHPIYIPKGKEHFVAHLEKSCFHITEGRYFGLYSNTIADPHFVGPSAPGVAGITLSCGSGLATSAGGVGTSSSSSVPAAAIVTAKVETSSATTNDKGNATKKTGKSSKSSKPTKKKSPPAPPASVDVGKKKKKKQGPTPTASSTELRKVMEAGGEMAEKLKVCITRAAVYASRVGKHGRSFVAPSGKVYPDVSKAFAAHAGLKPCTRCKNNKQGAYHCRLRRKHKELDYDGGDSPAALTPLSLEPLGSLILDSKKSTAAVSQP